MVPLLCDLKSHQISLLWLQFYNISLCYNLYFLFFFLKMYRVFVSVIEEGSIEILNPKSLKYICSQNYIPTFHLRNFLTFSFPLIYFWATPHNTQCSGFRLVSSLRNHSVQAEGIIQELSQSAVHKASVVTPD